MNFGISWKRVNIYFFNEKGMKIIRYDFIKKLNLAITQNYENGWVRV